MSIADATFVSYPSAIETADVTKRVTVADVEADLSRGAWFSLTFSPALEARYEVNTLVARAWNVRLTLAIGLVAYNVFTFVDGAILPDLSWGPAFWRIGIITPIALLAMWKCDRVGAGLREVFLTVMMIGAMIGPVTFILLSRAPLAVYTMLIVVLVSMFGNITIRLRFHWAVFFTLLTLLWVSNTLLMKPDVPSLLSVHLFLAILVCVSFGLVANNQLERAERRSFLLTLRETLKAEQLIADKADLSLLSQIDALTGLRNRRAFDARLAELWHHRHDPGQCFALLMIDVDFFKRFNDHYGHPAGDECLVRVGTMLRALVVRDQDLVARYGGEEFAVLLANCKAKDAVQIAERIRLMIRQAGIAHADRGDADQALSVSIGVAVSATADADSTTGFVSVADRNLYEAKRAGRNGVVLRPARSVLSAS